MLTPQDIRIKEVINRVNDATCYEIHIRKRKFNLFKLKYEATDSFQLYQDSYIYDDNSCSIFLTLKDAHEQVAKLLYEYYQTQGKFIE